jgi:hypothetical protein
MSSAYLVVAEAAEAVRMSEIVVLARSIKSGRHSQWFRLEAGKD